MHPAKKSFPNAAWRELRHDWLWVYRSHAATQEVWSPNINVPSGVFFVEAGQVSIRAGGAAWEVFPRQAFFSAPGLREHYFARNTRLCSVGFRTLRPDGSPLFRTGLNRVALEADATPLFLETLRLFRKVHRNRRQLSYLAATGPVALSLQELARREAAFLQWFAVYLDTLTALGLRVDTRMEQPSSRVELLLDWLNRLPLNQDGPLLPQDFGVGLRRADQLLRGHTGLGLRHYHTGRRILAAKKLLLENSVTIKEVVFRLGFRHASHFSAWFKRQVGVTPSWFKGSGGTDAA